MTLAPFLVTPRGLFRVVHNYSARNHMPACSRPGPSRSSGGFLETTERRRCWGALRFTARNTFDLVGIRR